MEYLVLALITFIPGVIGTGLGGVIGAIIKKDSHKIVSLLLSFAGGIMLAVVCFDLMTEPLDTFKNTPYQTLAPFLIILAVSVGYVAIWLLNRWIDKTTDHEVAHIDEFHPDTADDLDELIHSNHYNKHVIDKRHMFLAGLVMMFAIALHNFPEGMIIGAGYALEENFMENIFVGSGFIMVIVIGLHNIPEGMAVSVPLITGGMNRAKAILYTALSGFPTVLGALLGYLLGELSPFMSLISLGFASGAMLYVVLGELMPEAILLYKSKFPALATFVGLILGFLLVVL